MTTTKRIFLGMPGYGKQTADAGRGFWRACADASNVVFSNRTGSLLAANFNALWCEALNLVHRGEQVDYFAMLHDDIGPEDFWLDKLIAELEATQLDVLGVAVPIKDSRGVTSLALDNPGETWRPKCRLSMHDIYQLPETFTSDDVGAPLLLNTGCWVCRFDPAWAKLMHFTINDRIIYRTDLGIYQAQVEPEDWYFSRLLHERGLKIGATRKIKVVHRGEIDFTNQYPWGKNAFDCEYINRSPVQNAFPAEIPGWLLEEEGKALAELARGKRVLEIGSFCGRSTVCLARTAEHVTAVDYFDGRGTPAPQDTRQAFDANLARYDVASKVTVCHPDQEIPLPEYDLAFIDGAHDAESVRRDIARCLECLKPDGLLAFHDYRSRPGEHDGSWDAGVNEAVNELLAHGGELLTTHATLAVVRPPAAIPLEA